MNFKQIPQSVIEQQLNNNHTKDVNSLKPNIRLYAYKIVNLDLSELKNYTIQENSLNILRYEPLYFKNVKEGEFEVQCNWLDCLQTNNNVSSVPVESGSGEDIAIQNIQKLNVVIEEAEFFPNFTTQDFIVFTLDRPMEDCRIEDAMWLFYPTEISYTDTTNKVNSAYFNLISINALKIKKNSRIIFIKNKTNIYKDYKVNGLILTKPIETIIDTIQVVGYREGLAEEYQIPLSIEENNFTYCKFQVADENEKISLYFDWLDSFKILSFYYFVNKTENINVYKDIFNNLNKEFLKSLTYTICLTYIYNDGFSGISKEFNENKTIKNYDDYFYTLLQNYKNNISLVCDNYFSNLIFKIPGIKYSNDFMKYKSLVLMLNEFIYSNINFNGGFNDLQKLFLPYYFRINFQINRNFLDKAITFQPDKTYNKLTINDVDILLNLESTFFNFEKDDELNEYILKPLWNDISDKPLIGFYPQNIKIGWNEIKGKYLTINKELKQQNYLKEIISLKDLNTNSLKYLAVLFFKNKKDLSKFWKYRSDSEIDIRISNFEKDFGEDKSKDLPFLIEQTKIILENEGFKNIKTIDILGVPFFLQTYIKYTINGWIYRIRDLLLPAFKNEGVPVVEKYYPETRTIDYIFKKYNGEKFKAGDYLNNYAYIWKIKNKQAIIICLSQEYGGGAFWYNMDCFLDNIAKDFWLIKGSNFWSAYVEKKEGNEDNWIDPKNPFKWWVKFIANIKLGGIQLVRAKPVIKILNIFDKPNNEQWIYQDSNHSRDILIDGAIDITNNTSWNAKITFDTSKKSIINDFNVIYNRENWLDYYFQLDPSYITGEKKIDVKILFKDTKNFQFKKIKNIKVRGIWGGDFNLKIRYINPKTGEEILEELKDDRTKDSFVLFDNYNERITETNINFV